ncbi:MAG: hypothetical protein AAFY88_03610 [Acidobacteriota bacterium]
MATNCRLVNNTALNLHLKTRTEKGSDWEPGSYEIKSTRVDAHGSATFLRLNRDEGIRDGKTYVIYTEVKSDGREIVRFSEKLVGLVVNSDIWARAQTPDGSENSGWVPDGSAGIVFDVDGTSYRASLTWQKTSWNDDLEYTLSLEK